MLPQQRPVKSKICCKFDSVSTTLIYRIEAVATSQPIYSILWTQLFIQEQEFSFSNSSLGCVVAREDPCGIAALRHQS